ncbi:MAG: M20/M25/M40 family metallo-hydrolase [Bdellovibrionales bacterium]|nr:M20/M25/M40 family metallo-hydrolase [Bdellovibrionales bacterium]
MKTMLMIFLLSSFTLFGAEMVAPIQAVSKEGILAAALPKNLIIHEARSHWIVKTPLANMEKRDFYFASLAPNVTDLSHFDQFGKVLASQTGEFIVIEPKNRTAMLELAQDLHELGHQCGSLQKLSSTAIVTEVLDSKPLISNKDQRVADILDKANRDHIVRTVELMSSWGTRFESSPEGHATSRKLKEIFENLTPADRKDIEMELVSHRGSDQSSLVIRILGSQTPDELVILGSHLDSINSNNNSNAPGADDDASGTAANIEVYRLLMENQVRPLKTIEIHAYAAEEIGLVGSAEIAEQYRAQGRQVAAMVQFDLTGYSKDGKKHFYFVSNNTNQNLTREVASLVDTYLNTTWSTQMLLFGSSDHASWHKRGFPVAFPTENPFSYNRKIHSAGDTIDGINQTEQMEDFAKLGVAYLMHFAGYESL